MYALLLTATLAVAGDGYSWVKFNDGSADQALYRHGEQVGVWYAARGEYRPFNPRTRVHGEPCDCPVSPPCENFGLLPGDRSDRERFTRNGVEISREEAMAEFKSAEPPNIPDDATANRVVVIGLDADVDRVRQSFANDNALSPWRDKVVFQCFRPDDWQVANYGFQTGGKPVIYYLTAEGEVLHRQDDFEGGGEKLAEALREADTSYQPSLDKDRRNVWNGFLGKVKTVPAPFFGLLAFVAGGTAFLLMRRGS